LSRIAWIVLLHPPQDCSLANIQDALSSSQA
jgi:hypothetical protein